MSRKLKRAGRGAHAALARAVGVDASDLSHWLRGRHRPNARNRIEIWKCYRVPIASWDEPWDVKAAAA